MALKTGFPAVSGATQFPDLRLLFAGDIVCDTAGVPRAGVLPANFDPIVTGRADLKVDVAAMSYITVRSGGVIRGYNDGVVQVTLPALPTANSRIDILWVRQPMAASPTSDGSDVPLFGWTTGVASATPVRPSTALPAGALEIAQVQVAFNATATNDGTKVTITQTAPYTAFTGGVLPSRTKSALDQWTTATQGQKAAVVADTTPSLNGDYSWDGSAWSRPSGLNAALSTDSQQSTSLAPNGTFVFHTSTFTITQAVRVRVIAQINVLMVLNTAIAGYVQVVVDGTVVKNRRWQNRSVANVRVSPVIAWDEWLAPGAHTVAARIVSDGGSGANADVFDGYTEVVY